jgi:hypothetical protein
MITINYLTSPNDILVYFSGKNPIENLSLFKKIIKSELELGNLNEKVQINFNELGNFNNNNDNNLKIKEFNFSNLNLDLINKICKFGIYYNRNLLDIKDDYLKENQNNFEFDYLFLGPEFLVSVSQPALGMVYKIMEINKSPCIKFSEEKEKQTIPGSKNTYRFFNEKNEIICDYLCLENEEEKLKNGNIEAL